MSQPICPLPFAPVSDKGVVEGASLLPTGEGSDQKDFGNLLDAELGDEASESTKLEEGAAWAVYGHSQPVVQLPQLLLPSCGLESLNTVLTEPFPGGFAAPLEGAENRVEVPPTEGNRDSEKVPGTLESLIRNLKPVLQNLPATPPTVTLQAEQIAGKPPEAAKKANGIPVAQVPSMLFASHKEEESASQQGFMLSEAGIDHAFEVKTQGRVENAFRETAPKGDLDIPEFTPVTAIAAEWSSFEGIADVSELQAAPKVEAVEIAEAIRTHVELLRTSNHDKMDVVLRPDGQTELHLHVEKVNGQILVQARCDRGDFARLESNWSAVQQSLANQGVRVEALQNGATFQNTSQHWNHSSSSSGQQPREENKTSFIEQELTVPKRPQQSVASKGSARGWQSWA